MNLRHLALSMIALPISIAIGVALRTADAVPSVGAVAVAAGPDTETQASTRPQVPAVRVSRRDAASLRATARRQAATVSRLIPLAEADDSTRWR